MKKILIVVGIIIILAGLGGAGYWYWQSKGAAVEPLQKVTLDNPNIDSFEDVCVTKADGQLSCKGNIEQFDCEKYDKVDSDLTYLQPHYPMLTCENVKTIGSKDVNVIEEGVYTVPGSGLLAGRVTIVDYIIIKDAAFQLIGSQDQFRQLFQPINSAEEAAAYFQVLHKAVLVLDESSLNKLKSSSYGEYLVSPETLTLNSVTETGDGFTVTAYSEDAISCIADLYGYTFLVNPDGNVVEQSKTLIWHSDLECTS
jgi:hypothetical protein